MAKICAIHQPNFFPWLGFFEKIKQADIFVFLDGVQFPKTGGTWTNRVKLDYQGEAKYFTCPVKREHGLQGVNQVQISDNKWKKSFLSTISTLYGKSENFEVFRDFIFKLLEFETTSISEFNINCIIKLSAYLGLERKFVKHSELNLNTKSTDLLIDITKALDCDTYLCGGGATGYQEDQKFKSAGIALSYQIIQPSFFEVLNGKNEGLSIIHHLFKKGINKIW